MTDAREESWDLTPGRGLGLLAPPAARTLPHLLGKGQSRPSSLTEMYPLPLFLQFMLELAVLLNINLKAPSL